MHDNFFIITGGPGSGKTTLIEELERRGFFCVEEVARKIIQEYAALGDDARKNLQYFQEMLLLCSIDAYEKVAHNKQDTIFFDCGVIDYVGYVLSTNTQISLELHQKACSLNYNRKVFMAPPWEEIFRNDNERIQTFEEALKVYEVLMNVYSKYGYEIIELPKASVERRTEFVMEHIGS